MDHHGEKQDIQKLSDFSNPIHLFVTKETRMVYKAQTLNEQNFID